MSDEAAGITRRCSARLNPRTHTSGEGAGVTRHCSPRPHPQIHGSEERSGSGMTRRSRRRRASPEAPASLPDDDDMLREILLRLPPQPSSLLRASAVCKRWRRVAIDPRFLRAFTAHHRNPPLIGVFEASFSGITFRCILDPPDRVSHRRFNRHGLETETELLGCRHGRVLLIDGYRHKVIVWNPITGEHHHVDAPQVFRGLCIYGAVLCAAADHGHMHGTCHSSPFKVVLMSLVGGGHKEEYEDVDDTPPIACVYSSETGVWGDIISATNRCELNESNPGVLVGHVLYWSSKSASPDTDFVNLDQLTDDIIEFDLDSQSLAVIKGPRRLNRSFRHQIIRAEDGAVGLAILSRGTLEMWQRKVSCHGGATWLLQKTVEMHTILGLSPQIEGSMRAMEILGYDEDNGAIFLHADDNVNMVQLMSMQSRELYQSQYPKNCHPFTSFYAPGIAIPGGCNGTQLLHKK